jgi:hypothetical protein
MRAAVGTAVVAGTAAAVGGRVRHRQNVRWQQEAEAQAYEQQATQQPMAPVPAPPAQTTASSMSHVEQLQQLAALRDQGVLTDAEFEAEKAKVLNS